MALCFVYSITIINDELLEWIDVNKLIDTCLQADTLGPDSWLCKH
jgi:hypothetical protein